MTHLVGIDWGTSAFRAYLYNLDTQELCDKRISSAGMSTLKKDEVDGYLRSELNSWLLRFGQELPVIGSGMIGSDFGLERVDYIYCPTVNTDIYKYTKKSSLKNLNLWLVPGVCFSSSAKENDTMRGEETQLLGLGFNGQSQNQLVCMPGTHSKWVHVKNGDILRFRSAITGELFGCLKNSSFIREEQCWHEPAFLLGAQKGLSDTSLLSSLFSARSLTNFKEISAAHTQSYLSGLLIATEIFEMLKFYGELRNSAPVTVVGAEILCQLYENVFKLLNIPVNIVSDEKANSLAFLKLYHYLSNNMLLQSGV